MRNTVHRGDITTDQTAMAIVSVARTRAVTAVNESRIGWKVRIEPDNFAWAVRRYARGQSISPIGGKPGMPRTTMSWRFASPDSEAVARAVGVGPALRDKG